MWNRLRIGMLTVMLAGCTLIQAHPDDETAATLAATIGTQAGTTACMVAVRERPLDVPRLADAIARGQLVLNSPDPTLAALNQVLAAVGDEDVAFYAGLGVTTLVATLAASGVEVTTIEAGSPLAAGLQALLAACDTVIDAAGGVV